MPVDKVGYSLAARAFLITPYARGLCSHGLHTHDLQSYGLHRCDLQCYGRPLDHTCTRGLESRGRENYGGYSYGQPS